MNLILFGAGASRFYCDCGASDSRPPLGDELFNCLVSGGWLRREDLPSEIVTTFERSAAFEEGMGKALQHKDGSDAIRPILWGTGHFLSRFVPCKCTGGAYIRLLRGLASQRWRTRLATLNYDLILERTLDGLPMPPPIPGSREPWSPSQVIKPHGSAGFCLMAPRIFDVRITGFGRYIEAPVEPLFGVKEVELWYQSRREQSVAPAISAYAVGKASKYGGSFIDKQRRNWQAVAAQAHRVVIVGARYTSADSHIWGPLERTGAQVTYVNVNSEHINEYRAWNATRGVPDDVISVGFKEAVPFIVSRLT